MSRFQIWWTEVRDSLWFTPTLLTSLGIGLALLALWLDRTILAEARTGEIWWLFGGGAEGARGVLSAIATSIITVTGVVFSVTIVALQLASSQFTPRVLRNFTSDPANQVVLGSFVAIFTYSLLVERAIRSGAEDGAEFVPALSITIAILLALVGIGMLIFFVHHIARSIQVSVIIDRVAEDTLQRIESIFPARPGDQVTVNLLTDHEMESIARAPISAVGGGYLQSVDEEALLTLADRDGLVLIMEPRIGDFVLPGTVLALAGPAIAITEGCREAVRRAFVLGLERTPHQDPEFGIIELMDIAVKALSPGINDPTTASLCIDRLGEILILLGQREPPAHRRTGKNGALRFVARRTSFDRAVHLAFDQIRHYGVSDPMIAIRMLSMIGKMAMLVPAERRSPLRDQAEQVRHDARDRIRNPRDLELVEAEARVALARVTGADPDPGGASPYSR